MLDLDQLLARIDTTLTECDASILPPIDAKGAALRQQFEDAMAHGQVVRFDDLPLKKRALWRRIFLRRA